MNPRINKRKKNNPKKKTSNEIILPSLNPKIAKRNQLNHNNNIIYNFNDHRNKIQKLNNIKNQLKKQENDIKKKFNKPNIILRNHKPYSGNPSIKLNNNIIDLKISSKNIPNSFERDIFTANPSFIGNKVNYNSYSESIGNLKYINNRNNNVNNIASIKNNNLSSNEINYKENFVENMNQKYPYNNDKNIKPKKKIGFGISKSSPRISSIKIISGPFENQKQKEASDMSNKINIMLSYGDINNYKNNNIMKIKKFSKANIDSKNSKENNNSLINKDRNKYNYPNIGANLISSSEAQNKLIETVGKINSQLYKNHQTLKSANLKNQLSENYKKNGLKLLKNISKNSLNNSLNRKKDLNPFTGTNNNVISTVSPNKDSKSNNNNSSIKLNEEKLNKPKSKCFISYAYIDHPNLEHRKEMEDFHCIKQALGKKPNLSYFAIFDGHGGKEVASFLSINLHHYLVNEINNIEFGLNDEININNIIESIKIAFQKIDKEILNNENYSNDVGSTATLIFIYYNDLINNDNDINDKKEVKRTLICSNIGDSCGYLINKNNIKLITKYHKCDDNSEVQRIRDNGGIVFQGRIFGKLILTRTLGDKEMKKYGVLPLPDFFIKQIEKDDLFVIIASDGVWDVINEDELYKMGNEKELSSEIFSKKIIDIAKERDTRDNSSCIVIKLNKNI